LIELWDKVLLEPLINGLLVLSKAFGGSFGLAIITLTIIVNLVVLPLTLRQIKSTKAMQSMQPKMQELQKKYAKDKQKLQQETFKLYKESGVNPLGCALPLVIQMPVLIALYQAIMQTLPTTPEHLFGLSQRLYSFSFIQQALPPESNLLWINLAYPNFFLVLLVMATMWLSQKMSAVPSTDPKQQQMQSMMLWMMPLMFGFIFLSFPSGLSMYVIVGNVFRMGVQYFVMGWGGLATMLPAGIPFGSGAKGKKGGKPSPDKDAKEIEIAAKKSKVTTTKEEGAGDGTSRNKRKNRR